MSIKLSLNWERKVEVVSLLIQIGEGKKIQVLFGILGRFRFRLGVNKRNLINISVIKINLLTIEP